jgi:amidophosphoribosyltransferase
MADCGIVGIFLRDRKDIYERLIHSLHILQHRGEDACGIVINNNGKPRLERRIGLVTTGFHFTPDSFIPGDRGIGHTRYPTTNLTTELLIHDIQPIEISYPWIKFYIAHNGTITSFCGLSLFQEAPLNENISEENTINLEITISEAHQLLQTVRKELLGGTDTEIVGRLLAHLARRSSFIDAIKQVIPRLTGSFAFLIQWEDKVMGLRDIYGIRPLCIGELPDGYVMASESCVMNELKKKYYQGIDIPQWEVEPGIGVIISDKGLETIRFAESPRTAFCIFEYAYFSRPDSKVLGQTLSTFRQRCGERLGLRLSSDLTLANAKDSIIIPIPDGGIPFGVGLSRSTNIPLMSHGLIRDKYTGRTFIRGQQTYGLDRADLVMRKISFLDDVVKDKIVILADDSIVRGTTTRKVTDMAQKAGAKDVIWCFNFPPIRYICPLGIEMFKGGRDQFIANKVANTDDHNQLEIDISKILGAKKAYYMKLNEYLEELKLTSEQVCIGCIAGIYPFDELNRLYGSLTNEKQDKLI